MRAEDWIVPDWPAPAKVRALVTTRAGGVSAGRYAALNLADHVGDDAVAVARNRALLRRHLPAEPCWLAQVHGTAVVEAGQEPVQADACVAHRSGAVCAVLTADCLPVLLCDIAGKAVGAAHAGWRGLCAGVLEATVAALEVPPQNLLAYLGPAIGPQAFEVGDEVRDAFVRAQPQAGAAFVSRCGGKWLADLYLLARQRLDGAGVAQMYGGGFCTYREAQRFYSFRRDGETGRMASLIWLEENL